jgi:hypothetical protein
MKHVLRWISLCLIGTFHQWRENQAAPIPHAYKIPTWGGARANGAREILATRYTVDMYTRQTPERSANDCMSKKQPTSRLAGRDAGNGQFIPVERARQRRETAVVERVPLPGYGENNKGQKR